MAMLKYPGGQFLTFLVLLVLGQVCSNGKCHFAFSLPRYIRPRRPSCTSSMKNSLEANVSHVLRSFRPLGENALQIEPTVVN